MTDPGTTAPADQVDGLLADAFMVIARQGTWIAALPHRHSG